MLADFGGWLSILFSQCVVCRIYARPSYDWPTCVVLYQQPHHFDWFEARKETCRKTEKEVEEEEARIKELHAHVAHIEARLEELAKNDAHRDA